MTEERLLYVAGVRFQPCGKIYDFEVKDMELSEGDLVVVDSDLGLSIGKVVLIKRYESREERPLKPVLRRATKEDLERQRENKESLNEARAFCIERIMARGLPMKLVCSDLTLDRKRYIFYFTADTRIDFRELVKDLAAKFRTRIELRQIGVRDEAKLLGGIGICGEEVCCRRFLTSFEPVSIKMAKKQELALNTAKLSGSCGRLMCCLGFEVSDENTDEEPSDTIEPTQDTPEPDIICSAEVESQESGQAEEEQKKNHFFRKKNRFKRKPQR